MATIEECRAALERLAGKLAEVDEEDRKQHAFDRTLSCHVPGPRRHVPRPARGRAHHRHHDRRAPKAQIRLTADSDDLVAHDRRRARLRPGLAVRQGQGRGGRARPAQAALDALTSRARGAATADPGSGRFVTSRSGQGSRGSLPRGRRGRPPRDAQRPQPVDRVTGRPSTVTSAPPTLHRPAAAPPAIPRRRDGRVRRRAARSRRSRARYVGRSSGAGAQQVGRAADAGEHQQAGHAGPVGALDVGVQPVARPPAGRSRRCAAPTPGAAASPACRRPRPARRPAAPRDHADQRAVARARCPRGVGTVASRLRGDPRQAGRDGVRALGEQPPADVRREALHDRRRRRRPASCTGARPRSRQGGDAAPRRRPPAPRTRPGPGSATSVAAAWAEVTTSSGLGRHAQLAQVRGHRLRGPRRVVRDVRRSHPAPRRRPHAPPARRATASGPT